MKKRILAIGGGGAGMFSLIVPFQLKPREFETILLSDEENIYCRCTTPHIISGEAKLKDAIQPEKMFSQYGFKIIHEKATQLDTERKQVTTNTGRIIRYDYLVIATGASPFKPPIIGVDNRKVYTVRTSDDTVKIQKEIKAERKALVIGAGAIGLEMAGALQTKKLKVTVAEYSSRLSEHIFDQEFSDKVVNHLEEQGIKMMFNSQVMKIKDNKKGVKVVIKQGGKNKTINFDFVILATGVKPNLDIIQGTGIKFNRRGILVNREMKTSVKDVYACGDCCVPISAITREHNPSELASSAIQQAKIVGFQLAGYPIKYNGSTGAFAFSILGKEYAGVGLTEEIAKKKYGLVITGKAKTTNVYNNMTNKEDLEVKLIFAGLRLRLVGYEAFGKGVISSAEVASNMIGSRISILSVLKYNYIAHPNLTPWPFMNPIIMATEEAMGKALKKAKNLFKW